MYNLITYFIAARALFEDERERERERERALIKFLDYKILSAAHNSHLRERERERGRVRERMRERLTD